MNSFCFGGIAFTFSIYGLFENSKNSTFVRVKHKKTLNGAICIFVFLCWCNDLVISKIAPSGNVFTKKLCSNIHEIFPILVADCIITNC